MYNRGRVVKVSNGLRHIGLYTTGSRILRKKQKQVNKKLSELKQLYS